MFTWGETPRGSDRMVSTIVTCDSSLLCCFVDYAVLKEHIVLVLVFAQRPASDYCSTF